MIEPSPDTAGLSPHDRTMLLAMSVTLRDYILDVMNERGLRYDAAFKDSEKAVAAALAAVKSENAAAAAAAAKALDAALASVKESTAAAFMSSEKASAKTEAAQTSYNERTNELRGMLNDQAKLQLSRSEAESRFKSMEEKIDENKNSIAALREARSAVSGEDSATAAAKAQSNLNRGLLLSMSVVLIGWVITIVLFMLRKP